MRELSQAEQSMCLFRDIQGHSGVVRRVWLGFSRVCLELFTLPGLNVFLTAFRRALGR